MDKIVTAIEKENIRKELEKEIPITGKNILYEEGILELMEEEHIDVIIIQIKLIQKMNIISFLEKIRKQNSKIILLLEKKNENLQKYIMENHIAYFFIQDKEMPSKIKKEIEKIDNSQIELKKEIQDLKKLLLDKKQKKDIFQMLSSKKKKTKRKQKQKKHIISMIGPSGVGKSVVTVNLAHSFQKEYSRILVLDFDFLNNSLHTIYGVKKYPAKIEEKIQNTVIPISYSKAIKELAIRINKKIDLISGIDILFQKEKNKMPSKIQEIIMELQKEYELILIDTSYECFLDINKAIIECSDNSIFVTDTNLLGIKKARKILEIYIQKWKIDANKIFLLLNKINSFSIDEKIIKNIFSEFKILGEIKYNKKYDLLINQHNRKIVSQKEITQIYSKINKKIIKINTEKKENILYILKRKWKEA